MSKLHRDNAGYVGCSYEDTQDPYYSYNKLALPLGQSDKTVLYDEVTFTVSVAGGKFVIDGTSQATLSLVEGNVYTFDQSDSSNGNHPLKFSYTADGTHGGGLEYTLGVTTSGTPGSSGAYTRIVVPFGLHDLKYYCGNHSGMGGAANVVKNTKAFTVGRPILKTTDAFGKTLGSGNNADPYAANLVLAIPMAPGRDYTSEGTTSGSFYDSAGGAASKMFDADASTGAFSQSGTSTYTFGGTTITATSSVQIRAFKGDASGANVLVNGTDVSSSLNAQSSGGYSTVDVTTTLGGAPITLSSVSVVNAGGGSGNIAQIFVDGVELIDEPFSRDLSADIRGTGSAKTVTVNDADTSTNQSVFYGSSGYFDGNDALTIPDDSDFDFGSNNICIEFWFNLTSVANDKTFVGNYSGNNACQVFVGGSGGNKAGLQLRQSGGSYVDVYTSTSISANKWYHLAAVREASNIKIYLNGSLENTTSFGSGSVIDSNANMTVGNRTGTTANGITGYISDLRIYNGTSKYTTPFPTGSYGMDVVTYTGNGSTQNIGGLNFEPGLVWIKARGDAYDHHLLDSVRGATKALFSNRTNAETTYSNGLTSFNPDGFTLGGELGHNGSNKNYVAWAWKAGGASGTWVKDGTSHANAAAAGLTGITSPASLVSASINTTYGFSVIRWNRGANYPTWSTGVIPHGLPQAPKMIITKNLGSGHGWMVYHEGKGVGRLYLNSDGIGDTSGYTALPTSSAFTIDSTSDGDSADDCISYCWSEVSGFSKFGSFTGTGATHSIACEFEPAWVMIKCVSTTSNWVIYDSTRSPSNPANKVLKANTTNTEATFSVALINFNSDSFDVLGNGGETNLSGETYIYAAFAESASGKGFESHPVEQLDLNDLSGNSNKASNAGATFQTTVKKFYGGAAEFDGSSRRLTVPANAGLNFGTGDFTIEFWAFATGTSGTALMSSGDYYGSGAGNWLIRRSNSSEIAFATYDGTGNVEYTELTAPTGLNQWHHIALTRSGTTVQAFVDGSPGETMTVSKSLVDGGNNGIYIGYGNLNGYWPGYIQDVRIYKGIAKYTSSFSPPERSVQGTARRYPSGVYVVS